MEKKQQTARIKQDILFATPLWQITKLPPSGVYDWALEYQKKHNSVVVSNRKGYQSPSKKWDEYSKIR